MSDEEWKSLFGNLQDTINEYENVVFYYYPLALYLHRKECSLEHRPSEYDDNLIVCDDISTRFATLQEEMSYGNYVKEMLEASNEQKLLEQFNKLCSLGNSDDVLNELSLLYMYSQVPRCIPDEEYFGLFKILSGSVTEYENIFEVYQDLARFIHLLSCDFEHEVDEYGVHICQGLKKIYTE